MNNTKRKVIILDDFQYLMSNEFMRRAEEVGFAKFTQIQRHAWDILVLSAQLPSDVRVYFLSHTNTTEDGHVRMKTIGKLLDDKDTPEGRFSIVLRSTVSDGKHYFETHTNGQTPTKTPMGMFEEGLIDNDLSLVDKRICEFYQIKE